MLLTVVGGRQQHHIAHALVGTFVMIICFFEADVQGIYFMTIGDLQRRLAVASEVVDLYCNGFWGHPLGEQAQDGCY